MAKTATSKASKKSAKANTAAPKTAAAKAKETKVSKASKSKSTVKKSATKAKTSKAAKAAQTKADKMRNVVRACVVTALGLALIGLGAYAISQQSATNIDETSTELTDVEALVETMTVDLTAIEIAQWEELADGWVLLQSSMTTTDAARTEATGISDAVSFPFGSSDEASMKEELQKELLLNPIYGIGFIEFIKDVRIGTSTIGELNPWMEEAIETNQDGGVANWIEYGDDGETLVVNSEYRTIAAGLATLIDRLIVQGVGTYTTDENWSLNMTAENSDRRLVRSSYQYEGQFLVLAYVGKDGEALISVGVNTLDKRFALFQQLTDETATTTTTTTTTTGDPDPTDDPDPSPKKNSSATANNNSSAVTDGSGDNDNPGSGAWEEKSSSTNGSSAGDDSDAAGATAGSGTTGEESGSAPATDVVDQTSSTDGTNGATGGSEDLSESANDSGETPLPD